MGDIIFDFTTVLTLLLFIARAVIIVMAVLVLVMLFKVLIKTNKLSILNGRANGNSFEDNKK